MELKQALGGPKVLPDDWTTTVNVFRETFGGKGKLVVELGIAGVCIGKRG